MKYGAGNQDQGGKGNGGRVAEWTLQVSPRSLQSTQSKMALIVVQLAALSANAPPTAALRQLVWRAFFVGI